MAINIDWVYKQTCRLSHGIHVIYIRLDIFLNWPLKVGFPRIRSKSIIKLGRKNHRMYTYMYIYIFEAIL